LGFAGGFAGPAAPAGIASPMMNAKNSAAVKWDFLIFAPSKLDGFSYLSDKLHKPERI